MLSFSQDSRNEGKFLLQLHHIKNKATKSWAVSGDEALEALGQGLPKVCPCLQDILVEVEIVGVEGRGGAGTQEEEQPW